jgi:formylglycine-generating enzyme required for sulfatase activity
MVYVPGGEFTMGLAEDQIPKLAERLRVPRLLVDRWFGPQQPARSVDVPPFYMDRCEVTNAEYKRFVNAIGHRPPPSPAWEAAEVRTGFDGHPVTHVSWADASAYAQWAGKRLPSEEEWEKAARSPDGRLFPWGNDFEPYRAVLLADESGGPSPVGSLPDGRSPYGCMDMVGNVQEWTASDYFGDEEPTAGGRAPEMKVVRGAGWDESSAALCLCSARMGLHPDTRAPTVGFRCARSASRATPSQP